MKFSVIILTGLIMHVESKTRNYLVNKSFPGLGASYITCADESKVDPNLIIHLQAGVWEENENLKLWVHCVLVKNKLMSDQAVYQMDVALARYIQLRTLSHKDYKRFISNVDNCLPTEANLPMEIAWQFAKCFSRKAPDYSLF